MGNGVSQNELAQGGLDQVMEKAGKNKEKVSQEFQPFTEPEVKRMQLKYQKLDLQKKGYLNLEDLTYYPELSTHQYANRIFTVIEQQLKDEDIDQIDFPQFIQFLIPFHPNAGQDLKYNYLFSLFDVDGNGQISMSDLIIFYKTLYHIERDQKGSNIVGTALFTNKQYVESLAQGVLRSFGKSDTGIIKKPELKEQITHEELELKLNIYF